jgi:hypothetical protein
LIFFSIIRDKVKYLQSDKTHSDTRGTEKLIALEKDLCDTQFRLKQTRQQLEGVMAENNAFRKK